MNLVFIFRILKKSAKSWQEDKVNNIAAALSFYTIFALAPLFLLVLTIVGIVFSNQAIRDQLFAQLQSTLDRSSLELLKQLLENLESKQARGLAGGVSVAGLFLTASGLVGFLHDSLNSLWKISVKKTGLVGMLFTKAKHLGVVFLFSSIFLSSWLVSRVLTEIGNYIGFVSILQMINNLTFIILMIAFLAIFVQILLEEYQPWKPLFIGSTVTTCLIIFGNYLVQIYFRYAAPSSAYGAAGSIILLLLWINYVAQIFFFGLEITKTLVQEKKGTGSLRSKTE